jgi:hypothetical protein
MDTCVFKPVAENRTVRVVRGRGWCPAAVAPAQRGGVPAAATESMGGGRRHARSAGGRAGGGATTAQRQVQSRICRRAAIRRRPHTPAGICSPLLRVVWCVFPHAVGRFDRTHCTYRGIVSGRLHTACYPEASRKHCMQLGPGQSTVTSTLRPCRGTAASVQYIRTPVGSHAPSERVWRSDGPGRRRSDSR